MTKSLVIEYIQKPTNYVIISKISQENTILCCAKLFLNDSYYKTDISCSSENDQKEDSSHGS